MLSGRVCESTAATITIAPARSMETPAMKSQSIANTLANEQDETG